MKNKIVVVTGAFGVLGASVARAAAARGALVAALDYAPEPRIDLGADIWALGGVDLSDEGAAANGFAQVAERFGRIDALANIAGGFAWTKVADAAPNVWERLWALNLRTTLNASRAALTHGAKSIVNVGAATAVKAAAGMGPYAASKAAVHRLTEALADELKDEGVRVNAVLPSIIDTPANRADMPGADFTKWVAPADLAAIILFLLSDEARAVSGALVPVTGRV